MNMIHIKTMGYKREHYFNMIQIKLNIEYLISLFNYILNMI